MPTAMSNGSGHCRETLLGAEEQTRTYLIGLILLNRLRLVLALAAIRVGSCRARIVRLRAVLSPRKQ